MNAKKQHSIKKWKVNKYEDVTYELAKLIFKIDIKQSFHLFAFKITHLVLKHFFIRV